MVFSLLPNYQRAIVIDSKFPTIPQSVQVTKPVPGNIIVHCTEYITVHHGILSR